jgi:transcriptional regulator with XRE-family HTH domain
MPKTPTDERVGARIRALRLQAGLSQEKVGAKLGVTFQQLQKYEKGVNRVGPSRLEQLAKLFGVPVAHFFDDNGAKPRTSLLDQLLAANGGVKLARAFLAIEDAEVRRSLVEHAEALARAHGRALRDAA